MALTLSLGGVTVTFHKFLDTNYPRTLIQNASVEFSVLGTPALLGPYHQQKHLWSINAVCDSATHDLVDSIAYEFQEKRSILKESDILIYDTTATIKERSRTRAIVPNTVELSLNGGSHTAYYAVFKAAITNGPTFSKLGRYDSVNLILTETVQVAP